MKYVILILLLCIVTALLYKYIFATDVPAAFTKKLEQQKNPFSVPADSASVVWQRAKDFIAERKNLISGGTLSQSDSLLYIPYCNQYRKGNSIRIEKISTADSVTFVCHWWYSGSEQENGGKEIALYIQTGTSRYNKK